MTEVVEPATSLEATDARHVGARRQRGLATLTTRARMRGSPSRQAPTSPAGKFFGRRALLLAALGAILLVLFHLLPVNRTWLRMVTSYYGEVPQHLGTRDLDGRMAARHHLNYAILRHLRDDFLRPEDVLLLPPVEYVRRAYHQVYWNWAEPKYFYYMLGRRPTVTVDSDDLPLATCTVIVGERGEPRFVRFESAADLQRVLRIFAEQ